MSSKKYLIDLDEHIQSVISIGVTDSGNVYTIGAYKNELKGLNSYAESEYQRGLNDGSLDVKQRVEGAYQRGYDEGYDEGYKKCLSENDFDQPCISCDGYNRGLDEAMNAFKKLYSCGWEQEFKAMGFEFDEGDWGTSFEFIINHYSPVEIVGKIKSYEEQKDCIKVGDEVERYVDGRLDGRAMFLAEDNDSWACLFWTGCGYTTLSYPKSQFKRTGKHYEIEPILEGIRNES